MISWKTTGFVVAGLASLMVAGSGVAEYRERALHHREIAYARAHLGGAALASLAKGGDPDGGSERTIVGASRGDGGGLLGAAEELAARKAFPAQQIDAAQTFGAQQAFNTIKIRGNRGSRKGAFLWNAMGPTEAFVPGVLGFTGRDQVTGGRTTALLVDRTCNQGRCRVWIGHRRRRSVADRTRSAHQQSRLAVLVCRTRLERAWLTRAGSHRPPGRHAVRGYRRAERVR